MLLRLTLSQSLHQKTVFLCRFTIGPTEIALNLVRRQLITKHGWKRVGILSSVGTYNKIAYHLKKLIEKEVTVISTAGFIVPKGKEDSNVWITDQLSVLKENDVRIIVGLFSTTEIPLIMCKGYEMGLVDGYHVWILPEMNLNDVRRAAERYDTCDVCALFKNVLMVGQKYAGIDTSYHLKAVPINTSELDSLLTKYYENMPNIYNNMSLKDVPGYHLSTVIFDAAWAVMMALNESIQLLADRNTSMEFSLSNEDGIPMVKQMVLDVINFSLSQVKFSGLSGPVDLSNEYDMKRIIHILRKTTNNSICPVEMFLANETQVAPMEMCFQCCDYIWGNDPPSSEGLICHVQLPTIWLYFIIAAITVFMLLALTFIVLNIFFRKNNFMKASSLMINVLIIFGCTLVIWSSIVVYLAEQHNGSRARLNPLCEVELFLYEFGYTSIYVFLLLKTWRLYRIQTNKLLKKKIRCISDKAICLMLLILLVPVIMLFMFQSIFDPAKLTTELIASENNYPCSYMQYSICNDGRYMRMLLGGYKILLIMCIIWQAANVSQMKFKKLALEGDISIRLLILVVTISLGLHAIQIVLLKEGLLLEADVIYILTAICFPIMIIIVLFLPKFYMIMKDHQQKRRVRKLVKGNLMILSVERNNS